MPSRRAFLTAAGASALWSPALAKAFAAPARRVHGTIMDVEHVVILMQENRAFDHYFGSLRGVRGFGDPRPLTLPSGQSVFHQPLAPGVADTLAPFRLNSETTSAEVMQSLDHSWKGQNRLWRDYDAWIPVKGPLTMGHFTRQDIPFYYALADAFTICDAYHCSIFGPTDPNRLFLFTGTSGLGAGYPGLQAVTNADDGNETADPANDQPHYQGYRWTTYAERLQAAGVSWKLYQEYDNYGDNALAYFAAFRGLDPKSELYQRGRAWVEGSNAANAPHTKGEHLVAAFARDVAADALPAVSWIVAPTPACEHPDASPGYGEAFTAGLIEALAAHPDVFAKTVFLLNYDENDGFFDHMPPPVPAVWPGQGKSTVSTAGEMIAGEAVGLGPRVPMIVVSPWSRGGWVNSQLFDHTSVIRFLEQRFGVNEPNITPWRRAVAGDLTSAFDFAAAAGPPALPSTAGVIAQVDAASRLAPPQIPFGKTALPVQERGQRPSRALPYVLNVHGRAGPTGALTLTFENHGAAGAHFTARAPGVELGPWAYTVEAGKTLVDTPAAADLTVDGPGGFLRQFRGDAPGPEADLRYDPAAGRVILTLRNLAARSATLIVRPNAYLQPSPRRHEIAPGASVEEAWTIASSGNWYDLVVTADGDSAFLRRFAGRMETGRPGVSDPGIGAES